MNENNSFSLQKVVIDIGSDDIGDINQRINNAMQTYYWIYQNQDKHDVLVTIQICRVFDPKNIVKKSPNFKANIS